LGFGNNQAERVVRACGGQRITNWEFLGIFHGFGFGGCVSFYCVRRLAGTTPRSKMFELTVVAAYGRAYNSKAAIWADWSDGKDFQIVSLGFNSQIQGYGRYINKEDAAHACLACVLVRYGKNYAKSASINLLKGRMN
jgi:hypothetical protein